DSQSRRRRAWPLSEIGLDWLDLLLHHFASRHQIHPAPPIALRHLHGAMHELLHVGTDTDLVIVAHVAAYDAALIEDVLDPMDELVAAAARFALLRRRRSAGEDKHRDAALGRVVN